MISAWLPLGGTLARNAAPARRGYDPNAGLEPLLLLLLVVGESAAAEPSMYLLMHKHTTD